MALREGNWVVLAHAEPLPKGAGAGLKAGDMEMIKAAKITAFELYNLHDDVSQTKDLAVQEPERVRAMSERLRALYREILAEGPVWNVPAAKKQP